MKLFTFLTLLFPVCASAQLNVQVTPPKVIGNKAVVKLEFKNSFAQKVESVRAACFLLDEQGKMVAQSTKWVIGGDRNNPGIAAGATNAFHFVITSAKPFATTNLTAKVSFSRVILEGGKLADVAQAVTVTPAKNW